MIKMSEKEFLEYLEKYANKEISMPQLIKKLESDYRTINNKIIEISVVNPDLYYKIITNCPYKQKSRTDIDFEGLMIYIMKKDLTIKQAIDMFNVSRRTIQRRVNEMENTNPKLYKLFKESVGREALKEKTPELQEEINKLEYKEVVISEINEQREKFLLDIEKKFNQLIADGMSKEQATKEMGYTSKYVYKALNELYRLKIEKEVIKKYNKPKEFRESLNDMTQYTNQALQAKVVNYSKQVRNNEAR